MSQLVERQPFHGAFSSVAQLLDIAAVLPSMNALSLCPERMSAFVFATFAV